MSRGGCSRLEASSSSQKLDIA
eukprot:gene26702-biopygen17188